MMITSLYSVRHAIISTFKRYSIESSDMFTAPAAERNKQPILDVLVQLITDQDKRVLEVASGTGQHVAHFASHFKFINWWTTEVDRNSMPSINAHIKEMRLENVKPPVYLDVSKDLAEWPADIAKAESWDIIYNSNMVHISPFATAIGLFRGAGTLLKKEGRLIMYGPFAVNGLLSPDSNISFDRSLRDRNPEWGIRDTSELDKLAKTNDLCFVQSYDMPANNKILVYKKV